jgi:hypothetical protein
VTPIFRCGILLVMLGVTSSVDIRPSYSKPANVNQETFVKLQHDWAEARKKNDVAFLENFTGTSLQSEI